MALIVRQYRLRCVCFNPTFPLPVTPSVAIRPSRPALRTLLIVSAVPVSSNRSSWVASSGNIFVNPNLSIARLRESFGGCRVRCVEYEDFMLSFWCSTAAGDHGSSRSHCSRCSFDIWLNGGRRRRYTWKRLIWGDMLDEAMVKNASEDLDF